jgi:hypothetical protein
MARVSPGERKKMRKSIEPRKERQL